MNIYLSIAIIVLLLGIIGLGIYQTVRINEVKKSVDDLLTRNLLSARDYEPETIPAYVILIIAIFVLPLNSDNGILGEKLL